MEVPADACDGEPNRVQPAAGRRTRSAFSDKADGNRLQRSPGWRSCTWPLPAEPRHSCGMSNRVSRRRSGTGPLSGFDSPPSRVQPLTQRYSTARSRRIVVAIPQWEEPTDPRTPWPEEPSHNSPTPRCTWLLTEATHPGDGSGLSLARFPSGHALLGSSCGQGSPPPTSGPWPFRPRGRYAVMPAPTSDAAWHPS